METYVTYSGWIATVLSLLLALFTFYREKNFKDQVQIDNWSELRTAIQALAQCQIGLREYLEQHKENAHHEIVKRLAQSDAFGQELITDILRRIHYSFPKLTHADMVRWHAEGKLGTAQMDLLTRIALQPRLPKDMKVDFTAE